jgi:CheY-like chemotaxis protein
LARTTEGKVTSRLQPILLVEDNDDDVIFMTRAFKNAEIAQPLQIVNDGQQAIDYLAGAEAFADRARFPLPRLVLLDLQLPRKNGLEVLKWIREQPALQTLPVLVVSTSRETSDIESAYRLGANCYLVKPSTVGELMEMMKAFKAFWLTHAELAPA